MGLVFRLIAGACVATVLTQGIVIGACLVRGTLNTQSLTQIIALMNGIDITGQRLRLAMSRGDSAEQPDFDEILDARTRKSLDMDLRLDAQRRYSRELEEKLASLHAEQERFDLRREEFFQKLDEVRSGVQTEGMQELTRTLQALAPEQAKDQLLRMMDDGRIEDVVNIVQATPLDKRTDILAEFVSEEESKQLEEILRRIGEGEPATSLIDRAGR
ncbi:hypothetical protein [Roseimaritima ulvae]|uniref:MgtE intracellular N domain protein n=1 Tax=Roseimaritima ulvae TaxID=980254 RepID=A0A5B9QZZ7_9BACT|nr:hypothetical protein [Roseimaritima ulvae]QEG42736.1 hypothetical protein UC8_47780 [Roseimaritima ulvae]